MKSKNIIAKLLYTAKILKNIEEISPKAEIEKERKLAKHVRKLERINPVHTLAN